MDEYVFNIKDIFQVFINFAVKLLITVIISNFNLKNGLEA